MHKYYFLLLLVLVGCTIPEQTQMDQATVSRVIDGDTFVLENNLRVRLICIDTPERGRLYYTQATRALEMLVENKTVSLEKDVSETDRYGRLLRYVYVDDVLVNEYLVRQGYAFVSRYPPDIDRCDQFELAQRAAQQERLGLWENVSIE